MRIEIRKTVVLLTDDGKTVIAESSDPAQVALLEGLIASGTTSEKKSRTRKPVPDPVETAVPAKVRRCRPPKSADVPATSTALAEVRKAAADANLR